MTGLLKLSAVVFVWLAAASLHASERAEELFVRRIAPLLSEKCLACHGQDPKKLKADLDLRDLEAAQRGGESRQPGLIPGRPEESPIYLAATRKHEDWKPMPPKEADQLSSEQLSWLREWIAGGAPWPAEAQRVAMLNLRGAQWATEDGAPVQTSGGLSSDWTNRKYKPEGLWAYQPVVKPDVPAAGAIDALLALRSPTGLKLAPAAEARTLIRRATFDLTGLPPSPEEIAGFELAFKQNPDAAVEALIDRLLASPHYGERMAQHWLDVTRYADSSGFANDYERGNAWRYRDYVVRSYNDDKPYHQFVMEQIAGDEMDPEDSEKIIATGFLRMGPWELTGMEVAKVARQRFLDDVTNSVGETFLAHSLQCARCHDHKFDPVPTRDYYGIQAVFGTTQLSERETPFLPQENRCGFEEGAYLEHTKREHQATLAKLDAVLLENAQRWFAEHRKDPTQWNAVMATLRDRHQEATGLFGSVRNELSRRGVPEAEFPPKLSGFSPEQFGLERVARKGLERLKWELERYEPFALAVYDGRTPTVKSVLAPVRMPPESERMSGGELEQPCIHLGGDPFSEGPKVKPGILSVIGDLGSDPVPDSITGRRKAFAKWVTNERNPLTARAMVNRIWMWHFGQPIAGNPNNFGSTGKRPSHPELLDWLAATFVERGWSVKEMHRIIMRSAAYRRDTRHPAPEILREKDPLGVSYAVFKPRRLSAEEIRDAMLAASGELNLTVGGIPNRPEINLEAALQPRQVMGTFAAAWVPNPRPEQRNRRSLYALKLRGLSDPAMEVFNAPSPDFSCERRETSTVTPQVFALFNSKASYARALALARRCVRETSSDEEALGRCFQLVLGRAPRLDDIQICLRHWQAMTVSPAAVAGRITPPLTVKRDAVEENTGEHFSFDETLQAYADYVPDLQGTDVDARTRGFADVCLVLLNSSEFVYVY